MAFSFLILATVYLFDSSLKILTKSHTFFFYEYSVASYVNN